MTATVVLIAIALVAIALGVLALRIAHAELASRASSLDAEADPMRLLDEDVGEIRRGDRPDPPAPTSGPAPDNVAPFVRPENGDDRR